MTTRGLLTEPESPGDRPSPFQPSEDTAVMPASVDSSGMAGPWSASERLQAFPSGLPQGLRNHTRHLV